MESQGFKTAYYCMYWSSSVSIIFPKYFFSVFPERVIIGGPWRSYKMSELCIPTGNDRMRIRKCWIGYCRVSKLNQNLVTNLLYFLQSVSFIFMKPMYPHTIVPWEEESQTEDVELHQALIEQLGGMPTLARLTHENASRTGGVRRRSSRWRTLDER